MSAIANAPSPARYALRLAATLALLALLAAGPARAVVVTTVEWTPTAVGELPASDAQWTRFDLPLRWSAGEATALQGVALRMKFRLAAPPTEAWAVLLGEAANGGRVSVNGRFIGAIRMPDARSHVRWRRPHLLAIDPSLLVAGENVLLVQTAYRGGTHVFAGVEVGSLAQMSARYEEQFFQSYTLTWIGATLAAVITLLFGVLWLRRPEPLLALLAVAAALWILRSSYFVIETMPLALRFWLRLAYYTASGGFAAVMTMALLRLSGRREPRDLWLVLGYAAIGPLLLAVTAQRAAPYIEQLWMPGLVVMAGIGFGYAVAQRARRREAPPLVLLAAMALTLAAAVHDFMLWRGVTLFSGTLALHWAGPLLLIALATPLVDRFVRILREAETARAELETRVREREQLLKRNFERLRESERLQATAQERQRIMQDMHDGLGSQLLSSLMLVERGAVTQEQVAQILRECIDDMRLAIDALASEDAGLLSALGNLRFRMEPRLRAAGIELAWDARGLPEEIDINPDAVLPILRIVQEALTNALKHSRARAVHVVLAMDHGGDSQWLNIRVTDNGRGITEERVGGRGLLNMRNRASRIGAQLKLETVPGAGTMVQLVYRLEPQSATTTTRMSQLPLNTEAIIERARQI
ncbi:MAG: sensor histidine kinase [Pseudomonadota bacterium]